MIEVWYDSRLISSIRFDMFNNFESDLIFDKMEYLIQV